MTEVTDGKKYPYLLVLDLHSWPDTSPETVRGKYPTAIYGWIDLDTDRPYKGWYIVINTPDEYAAIFTEEERVSVRWDQEGRGPHTRALDYSHYA
jgi:hypothetical protein